MSTSEYWRRQGNDMVTSASSLYMQHGWEDKMKESIVMYQKALGTALDDDETASASKNIGVVALKIADFLATVPEREKSTLEYYGLAVRNLTSAIELGGKSKGQRWVANLDSMQTNAVKSALRSLKNITLGAPRLYALNVMLGATPEGVLKQHLRYEQAETSFKSAIVAQEKLDYKKAIDFLKSCEGPLSEMQHFQTTTRKGFGVSPVAESEIEELKFNIDTQFKLAEALRCILQGDDSLEEGTSDHENLHMGTVWQAVDLYQNAIILSEGISVELEARAQSRLGRALYKVMKWLHEARLCFNSAMNLIDSVDLKQVKTTDWYLEMTSIHSKAQRDSYIEEESKIQNEEIMKELKSELDELDDKSDAGPEKLLEYVYDRYARKHKECSLSPGYKKNFKNLKKALRDASVDYHPDKIDEKVHGKAYKVMSREICKRINKHYDDAKNKKEESKEKKKNQKKSNNWSL